MKSAWITDISPLADLKYLFTLDLSGNNIQSLEPLEPLGFLQELNLSLTSGVVYSPRSASSEETDIPSFEKYTALDRFSSLETLNLSYNGFSTDTHLEFLRGMTSLKSLDLSGKRSADHSFSRRTRRSERIKYITQSSDYSGKLRIADIA
ncbi:MAG: hypothetical protein IKI93_07580 [Clostridia bacterium]|nr:hypothetical protein [Clostridia bacterium]